MAYMCKSSSVDLLSSTKSTSFCLFLVFHSFSSHSMVLKFLFKMNFKAFSRVDLCVNKKILSAATLLSHGIFLNFNQARNWFPHITIQIPKQRVRRSERNIRNDKMHKRCSTFRELLMHFANGAKLFPRPKECYEFAWCLDARCTMQQPICVEMQILNVFMWFHAK